MRKRIIAGNWKMNMDHIEGSSLASLILEGIGEKELPCEVVVIPPFTTLPAVAEVFAGSKVDTGAQDLWYEDAGAFTGEISGSMISRLGCRYVLVGHSERRHILGEGSGILALKLRAALRAGLTPIYCVGEAAEERESGNAEDVVEKQVREVLEGLGPEEISRTVVAYEPVWAIGTGKTATPEDASGMHSFIRGLIAGIFDKEAAGRILILYGGSVKPGNASELLGCGDIDGALVGGASLDAGQFLGIIFS
ncbi:MAG: triose-phosphate isomerase [Candidatus Krumholzibacteriota bacterium]|nr:triose-phosphate isomerase [Candidatus Krumholzibacteriota bacterium]